MSPVSRPGQTRRLRAEDWSQTTTGSGSTIFSRASSLPGPNYAQEWDLYDDMDTTAFKMVRANSQHSQWTDRYRCLDWRWGWQITPSITQGMGILPLLLPGPPAGISLRSVYLGWRGELLCGRVLVPGVSLAGLPSTFNRVSVEGLPDGPTVYYVDDFRVRKYTSTAPTVVIGTGGQPAVDLAITLTDTPDPLKI